MQQIHVKVPGKLMLFGEYSVLWEEKCLAFTPHMFMDISAKFSLQDEDRVSSDLWEQDLIINSQSSFPEELQNHFMIELIHKLKSLFHINQGLTLKINSAWPIEYGLGSSSALILGTSIATACLALQKTKLTTSEQWKMAQFSKSFQEQLQGFSSGYDLASQLKGGFTEFSFSKSSWPLSIDSRMISPSFFSDFVHIFVGGKGAPTKRVGTSTLAWIFENHLQQAIINVNRSLLKSFVSLSESPNDPARVKEFFHHMKTFRNIFAASPHFPQKMKTLFTSCDGLDKTFTYKTTGAGGEDALILFGTHKDISEASDLLNHLGWHQIDMSPTYKGLSVREH